MLSARAIHGIGMLVSPDWTLPRPAGVWDSTLRRVRLDSPTTSLREDRPIARLKLFRAAAVAAALVALAACSGGQALPGGLTQRMDQPGAAFDRAEALAILNQYRATVGAAPLAGDTLLDTAATDLAVSYARTGTAPKLGPGVLGMRTSAGYANFAETFSGWRASPDDAAVIATRTATRAGLGVTYNANSAYGVYWVLILDD